MDWLRLRTWLRTFKNYSIIYNELEVMLLVKVFRHFSFKSIHLEIETRILDFKFSEFRHSKTNSKMANFSEYNDSCLIQCKKCFQCDTSQ